MKQVSITLSVLGAVAVLTVFVLFAASEAEAAPAERLDLTKQSSNATPRVGEIFTYTLQCASSSGETQPVQVRLADPNPAPLYMKILTPTVTGGAWYSPTIDGIVWEGTIVPGSASVQVNFQVQVTGIPVASLDGGAMITNTATAVDLARPGSLPEQTAEAVIRIVPLRYCLPLVVRNSGG